MGGDEIWKKLKSSDKVNWSRSVYSPSTERERERARANPTFERVDFLVGLSLTSILLVFRFGHWHFIFRCRLFWFGRTALIEYFHMFHTIFVARILRFSQCNQWKFSKHFLIEYLSFSSKFLLVLAKMAKKCCKRLKKCVSSNWHNNWQYFFRIIGKMI